MGHFLFSRNKKEIGRERKGARGLEFRLLMNSPVQRNRNLSGITLRIKHLAAYGLRFQHSGVFRITNEISFTIISLSSSDKFHLVLVQKGSPEVVYPRVNNFSILILFLS